MIYRARDLIRRTLQLALIVTCMVAGSTGPAQVAAQPTAAATLATTAPLTGTPQMPSAAVTAPARSESPTPGAAAAAKRATCESYVAVLSGRTRDRTLLEKREVQELARRVPDLVTCAAVGRDSNDACKELYKEPAGKTEKDKEDRDRRECRWWQSIFHELRAYPNGRSFMFNDVQFEECKRSKELAPLCDPFRAAARSGDASKCASFGEIRAICEAQIRLDKSLCRAPHGTSFSDQAGAEMARDCVKQVDSLAILAKGLKATAESAPAGLREFAKAALGQADACASFAQAAMDACVADAQPVPTPVPGTPVSEKPIPSGMSPPVGGSPGPTQGQS